MWGSELEAGTEGSQIVAKDDFFLWISLTRRGRVC